MQLYALDDEDHWVAAHTALRGGRYRCVECRGALGVRQGQWRQPHYYHLQSKVGCRQQGKSVWHLHVQQCLQACLAGSVIEQRFDTIHRIADVAWHEERLVFEIQCSPIDAEELRARTSAYSSQGYQVVWILDDSRYRQSTVSGAEECLIADGIVHYFVDHESGAIYDQYSVVSGGRRSIISEKFFVDLSRPERLRLQVSSPHLLKARARRWHCHFHGDLLSRWRNRGSRDGYLARGRREERRAAGRRWLSLVTTFFLRWIYRPYHIVFRMVLESACRQ